METRKIIINDTHFGVKNNSIKFLESQKKLFSELCDYMRDCDTDRFDLIHLGDIFDSRSTLSMQVMYEVKEILWRLNFVLKKRNPQNRFIFVAGNHDFFSPNSDEVNSLDTILKEILPDAQIVDKYCWRDGDDLYIPWYQMNDPEKFNLIKKINAFDGVQRVFTHCDCKDFQNKIPAGFNIYSGHIHQYHEYTNLVSENNKLINLATPYSLDFGDSNDNKKGFWVLDGNKLTLHENKDSIKFRTFINEQIFDIPDLDDSIERGDNFRIYLTEENRTKIEYIERLNELSTSLKYINIILTSNDKVNENFVSVDSLDIDNVLTQMVPEHLREVFNVIRGEIKEGI